MGIRIPVLSRPDPGAGTISSAIGQKPCHLERVMALESDRGLSPSARYHHGIRQVLDLRRTLIKKAVSTGCPERIALGYDTKRASACS